METLVEVCEAKLPESKDSHGRPRVVHLLGVADEVTGEFVDRSQVSRTSLKLADDKCKVRVEVWIKENDAESFQGFTVIGVDYGGRLTSREWHTLLTRPSTDVVTGEVYISVSWKPKVHQSILTNHQQRMVRVFLSSTFLDMHEEREVIMQKVMVDLNRFCYERGVSLTYIDMRWGITKEMGDNAQTILTCLREVDHSRPYFVGILGDRYGWHQEADKGDALLTKSFELAEAFKEFEWINQFRTKSVTELEIQHGFLLNSSMAKGHVIFFFRDPNYINSIEASRQSKFKDTTPYAVSQMAKLKQQIKDRSVNGECVVHDNYANPAQLGEVLLADLKASINADFPPLGGSDKLLQKQNEHLNYARQRCEAYVQRQKHIVELNSGLSETASQQGRFILVTGASGSGKSAFLANWWLANSEKSACRLFAHFVGSSLLASDFTSMLIRLFEEINSVLTESGTSVIPIPSGERELVEAIQKYLDKISLQGGMVIILDAINQLLDQYHGLHWLPLTLPPKVNVIISCIPECTATIGAVQRRSMDDRKVVQILPLNETERREIIKHRLSLFGKTVTADIMGQIASHTCSELPLFLTTVLNELCTIGFHSMLAKQVSEMLACRDISSLFRKVISRWEANFQKELVPEVLLLIHSSRLGVTEATIQEISQAPHAILTPLISAIKQMLVVHHGKFNFCHQYLQDAVQVQQKLVRYLQQLPFDKNIAQELPWVLSQTVKLASNNSTQPQLELAELLLDLDKFTVFASSDDLSLDLVKYWNNLQRLDAKWDMGKLYCERAFVLLDKSNTLQTANTLKRLGKFLQLHTGFAESARQITESALQIFQQFQDQEGIASSLDILGECCSQLGKYSKARDLHQQALDARMKLFGDEYHPDVADSFASLAGALHHLESHEAGLVAFEKALAIRLKLFGENHPVVALSINDVGVSLSYLGKVEQARQMYEQGLALRLKAFGGNHLDVAESYSNLAASCITQGRLIEAKEMCEKALQIRVNLFGDNHHLVVLSCCRLGVCLQSNGNMEDAKAILEKGFAIALKLFGQQHPTIAQILGLLASVARETGKLELATELFERALSILLLVGGHSTDSLNGTYISLARLHAQQGRTVLAKELMERALCERIKQFGQFSPEAASSFIQLARYFGDDQPELAEELLQRALTIRLTLAKEGNPSVVYAYTNLGFFYQPRNLTKAKEMMEEALFTGLKMFKEHNTDVADSYDNLATILSAEGNHTLATELLEKSVEIRLKLLGKCHKDVATSFKLLGESLLKMGKCALAIELLEQALAIDIKLYGGGNLGVAISYHELAELFYSQGDLKRTKEMWEKSAIILVKLVGPEHEKVNVMLNNLAVLWVKTADKKRQTLEQYFATLGVEIKVNLRREQSMQALQWTGGNRGMNFR